MKRFVLDSSKMPWRNKLLKLKVARHRLLVVPPQIA
jgi:hypothetical protein